MIIKRLLEKQLEHWLFKEKIIIVYGPRQVGKTTMVKNILQKYGDAGLYLNCENAATQNIFSEDNPQRIRSFFEGKKVVVLDEAQTVLNIGRKLKIYFDEYKDIQIIATGSSSFDLANKINEPLTGRVVEFTLLPLSVNEIISSIGKIKFLERQEEFFNYGFYPQIVSQENISEKKFLLENLNNNYLFKDIFTFENIKKPFILGKLVKSLSFRVGSEVSYGALANELDVSSYLIEKYMDLLEKVFIIKRLYGYSNNKENELKKKFKVYFLDIGFRNTIIQAFGDMEYRDDKGTIFENFCFMENIKSDLYSDPRKYKNYYFWRNYKANEIDLIEEFDNQIVAKEFKYKKYKINSTSNNNFLKASENKKVTFLLINKDNYLEYF